MIKNIYTLFLAVMLFSPSVTVAATLFGGEMYALRGEEAISDNLYVGAGDMTVAGNVSGDAVLVGGSIVVSGSVRDDVALGGGNITLLGPVGGDARIAGGTLVIGAPISGDLVIAGGTVKILDGTTIGKDLVLAGGTVAFAGDTQGNARIAGGQVVIDGTIQGNVEISADKIILGEHARVEGSLVYHGQKEDVLEARDGSSVLGGVQFEQRVPAVNRENIKEGFIAAIGVFFLLKLLAIVIMAVVAVLLFKSFSREVVSEVFENPWMNMLRGFVVLVVVPVASIVLFMTVLGVFIGLFALLAYILVVMTASMYSGVVFGSWLHSLIRKEKAVVTWSYAVIGIILLATLKLVPIIGWIIACGFFLATFGAVWNIAYQRLWLKR